MIHVAGIDLPQARERHGAYGAAGKTKKRAVGVWIIGVVIHFMLRPVLVMGLHPFDVTEPVAPEVQKMDAALYHRHAAPCPVRRPYPVARPPLQFGLMMLYVVPFQRTMKRVGGHQRPPAFPQQPVDSFVAAVETLLESYS